MNMLKGLFKLFHKEPEEEFNPYEKFRCKVYSVETNRYLGEVKLNWNEYKEHVAFDTKKKYVRVKDDE